jgi:hypothetical protein
MPETLICARCGARLENGELVSSKEIALEEMTKPVPESRSLWGRSSGRLFLIARSRRPAGAADANPRQPARPALERATHQPSPSSSRSSWRRNLCAMPHCLRTRWPSGYVGCGSPSVDTDHGVSSHG